MRLIGLIFALAAIMWTLYQASGGKDSESVIPEEYQRSLEKAESVEQTMKDSAQQRLEELDKIEQ